MKGYKILKKNGSNYSWGNTPYESYAVQDKVRNYCKAKMAGKVQYQLYVEVDAAQDAIAHITFKEITALKFFKDTIENEMLPVEKEYVSPYGIPARKIIFVPSTLDDGAEITALDDGSNDELEEDFLASPDTSIDEDNETEELIDAAENKVLIVADQFTALELVEDYYPNLIISGKLTKSNGVLTAINGDGVQVAIHDDHLEVDSGNGIWRIDYDIAESDFRRVLREVTLKMIENGANCPTFEIVGKSGLIYTYTEATLKPIFTETQIEHDTRINSAPPKNLKIEIPANVNELWKILRQKQQALKAIMTENSIAATRKYNVQFAEIKVIVNEINRLTQTAAA